MRRQLALSIRIASIFMIILLGLPLLNYALPSVANLPVFGFTATWLFLGILFYPLTWFLSWLFIRRSNEIEASLAADMSRSFADVSGLPLDAATPAEPTEER